MADGAEEQKNGSTEPPSAPSHTGSGGPPQAPAPAKKPKTKKISKTEQKRLEEEKTLGVKLWLGVETGNELRHKNLVVNPVTSTLTTTERVGRASGYEQVLKTVADTPDAQDGVDRCVPGFLDTDPTTLAQNVAAHLGLADGGATRVVACQLGAGVPGGVSVKAAAGGQGGARRYLVLETPLRFAVVIAGAVYAVFTVYTLTTHVDDGFLAGAWKPVGPSSDGMIWASPLTDNDIINLQVTADLRARVASSESLTGVGAARVWTAFRRVFGRHASIAGVSLFDYVPTGGVDRLAPHTVLSQLPLKDWKPHVGVSVSTPAVTDVVGHRVMAPARGAAFHVVLVPPCLESFPMDMGTLVLTSSARLTPSVVFAPSTNELCIEQLKGTSKEVPMYGSPSPWISTHTAAVQEVAQRHIDAAGEPGKKKGVVFGYSPATLKRVSMTTMGGGAHAAIHGAMSSLSGGRKVGVQLL